MNKLLLISIILRFGSDPKKSKHYFAAMGLAHVHNDEDNENASS